MDRRELIAQFYFDENPSIQNQICSVPAVQFDSFVGRRRYVLTFEGYVVYT